VLTKLKQLEYQVDDLNEGEEYLDAFVFLGGQPNKEGCVNKSLLIEIIKEEFGLTIDMVVSWLEVTAFRNTCARSGERTKRSPTTISACS